MKHFCRSRFMLALAFFVASVCSPTPWARAAIDLKDITAIADGNNQFATELYTRLAKSESGNLFFSPYSISTALAMTYNGARGPTAAQMSQVLHFKLDLPRMNPAFAALAEQLHNNAQIDGSQDYDLTLANALWAQAGFSFNNDFIQTLTTNFVAAVQQADFISNSAQAANDINAWVGKKTDDKIQNLVSPDTLKAETRMVLVNAIYFQGNWASPFKASRTQDRPFHVSPISDATVSTMNQKEFLSYMENDDLQIAEFPYVGDNLMMTVLLPRSVDGLATLEEGLTLDKLNQWLGKTSLTEVEVYLPKFESHQQFELSGALSAMGMPVAFSRQADFLGISAEAPLRISQVIHKAYVEVDEVGTKAAAATGVTMSVGAVFRPAKPPPVFRADHPFLFLIRDRSSGAILFMGRMKNPTEK